MVGNNLSLGIDIRKNQLLLCLLQKTWRGVRLVDYQIKTLTEDFSLEDQLLSLSDFVAQYPSAKEKSFSGSSARKNSTPFPAFTLSCPRKSATGFGIRSA